MTGRDRWLVGVGLLVALFLAFNVAVWGTDLAIKPVDTQPCLGIWGELSCTSHPPVLIVTVVSAVIASGAVWALLRAHRRKLAAGVVLTMVLSSAWVFLAVREDCADGSRLGVEQSAPRWVCVGGVK